MNTEVKELSYLVNFSAVTHDVLVAGFNTHVNVDLVLAKAIVAQRIEFMNHREHYLVADFSRVLSITPDAKKFLQQPEFGLKNILGAALVASNPLSALLAHVFIKSGALFRSRFFFNQADAISWIMKCRKEVKDAEQV